MSQKNNFAVLSIAIATILVANIGCPALAGTKSENTSASSDPLKGTILDYSLDHAYQLLSDSSRDESKSISSSPLKKTILDYSIEILPSRT